MQRFRTPSRLRLFCVSGILLEACSSQPRNSLRQRRLTVNSRIQTTALSDLPVQRLLAAQRSPRRSLR